MVLRATAPLRADPPRAWLLDRVDRVLEGLKGPHEPGLHPVQVSTTDRLEVVNFPFIEGGGRRCRKAMLERVQLVLQLVHGSLIHRAAEAREVLDLGHVLINHNVSMYGLANG